MRSPFPGMDPCLERPDRWSGVHARLIAVMGELLTREVAPRFFVDSDDSVYVLGLDDPARPLMRPDLYVADAASTRGPSPAPRGRISTPVVLDMPAALEIRTPYLNVIDTVDRRVVTTIEVLSPINKTPGSSGQRDFLRKREQVFRSDAHWLEIDLLRGGTRPPGIPPRGAYDAALHRTGSGDRLEAWFVGLREPLPTIAVPLRSPFEDVPLDVQAVLDLVYDRYRYDTAVDYGDAPPAPSMDDADSQWIKEHITAWRQSAGR